MSAILMDTMYLYIILGVIVLLGVICAIFGNFFMGVKKEAPSIMVFRKAYKQKKKIVEVIDGDGVLHHFVGEKEKKYDVEYKNKDFGIKIDSRYSTISPEERMENGVPVIRYGINLHFPTDSRGTHALVSLVKYIRNKYEMFDIFTDDMVLIELIDVDSDELYESIYLKLKDFDTDFVDDDEYNKTRITEMMDALEEIKKELPNLKIRSEPISIATGQKLIPTAFTAQDYNKGLQLKEYQVKKEGEFETKIMTYAVACVAILGAVGLIVYLWSTMK